MKKNIELEQDIVSVEEFMLEQETDFQTVQDEVFMEEQSETKWNNKKKISKKTIILRIIISFVMLGIVGFGSWFFLLGNQAKADSDEVAIVLEAGQELVTGKITSIIGNEVTIDLVEEKIADASTQTGNTTGPSKMEMPDTMTTYYNSLGESQSLQIPVGTEVITKLGTVTTFSRLAVGDVIKVIMGSSGSDSYIVKIYIVD